MAEKLDKAREEVAEAQKRIDEITEKIAAHNLVAKQEYIPSPNIDPLFQEQLDCTTANLMAEFASWNDIQKELKDKGCDHNHYSDAELACEQVVFRAIA